MRTRLAAMPSPVLAGLLVFVMAFALYAFSTQRLTGYEPETGAVTEGLVLEGHFWDKEDSPLPSPRPPCSFSWSASRHSTRATETSSAG